MAIWEKPELIAELYEEKKKAELALCIPHQSIVTMRWAIAFKHLKLPSYIFFLNRGSPIDVARETMVRSALKHDIKYIFFLDSDCAPEDPNAVFILKEMAEKYNIDVLSGLYWAKKTHAPNQPTAWKIVHRKGNEIKFGAIDIAPHMGKIIEVDAVGLGFCLIKRKVFDMLEQKNPNKPFFVWGLGRKELPQISEDFYFCIRIIDELNIHPHVATMVKVHHICIAEKLGENGKLELVKV